MFTGIVTHRGEIVSTQGSGGQGRRLSIRPEPALPGVGLGDSIALDGVCLTVAAIEGGALAFDVVPETLRRTTLGLRVAGERMNLEPSLHLGDEMGGHVVQGHVEGVGEVVSLERQGEDVRMVVHVGDALFGGMIPKGSVTLDGVSLTIGEVASDRPKGGGGTFSVYLVPHTLAVTGLGPKKVGEGINVEPDVLGRWVEHHVRRILGREESPTR